MAFGPALTHAELAKVIKVMKLRCLSTRPTYEKNDKYEKGDLA